MKREYRSRSHTTHWSRSVRVVARARLSATNSDPPDPSNAPTWGAIVPRAYELSPDPAQSAPALRVVRIKLAHLAARGLLAQAALSHCVGHARAYSRPNKTPTADWVRLPLNTPDAVSTPSPIPSTTPTSASQDARLAQIDALDERESPASGSV